MRKFTVNKDILVNKFKLRLYCKSTYKCVPRSIFLVLFGSGCFFDKQITSTLDSIRRPVIAKERDSKRAKK
uniref:Uncharacterized protein n=1 Tax=Trichogramma kaykai TaxID=54128 RepID=A0ABD2WJS8_9HYME